MFSLRCNYTSEMCGPRSMNLQSDRTVILQLLFCLAPLANTANADCLLRLVLGQADQK